MRLSRGDGRGLTGAIRDSRLGWALTGGGSGAAGADLLLTLLASFISFFHDTNVVSPGRSSTVNICLSPNFTYDGVTLDEDDSPPPSPPPRLLPSSIEAVQGLVRILGYGI